MDQLIFLPWLQRLQPKELQYKQLQADQTNVTIAQKVRFFESHESHGPDKGSTDQNRLVLDRSVIGSGGP